MTASTNGRVLPGSPDLPGLSDFDPTAPDFMNDPWPYYETLRRAAPVYRHPESGVYFIASYAAAQTVMKDHETFSALVDRSGMRKGGLPEKVLEIRAQGWPMALTLSHNDTPSHDDYRALVHPFFTPKVLQAKAEPIAERIDGLIADMADEDEVDFVSAFAVPLPISVIGDYLGLADYGYDQLKIWSDAFADEIGFLTSDARAVEIAELTLACHRAMIATCEARRDDPREDIITHLATAELPEGRRLNESELLSILTQLLVAGNETTTNSLSAGILRLARTPAVMDDLRARPDLIPRFVEELLRLESPVQGQFRKTTRPVTLEGVEIPEDALLHVRLASANRDQAAFGETADEVDLATNRPKQHMAFGAGLHFCVGAMLSRLELRLAFERLLARVGRIELVETGHPPQFATHFHLRGLTRLLVRLR